MFCDQWKTMQNQIRHHRIIISLMYCLLGEYSIKIWMKDFTQQAVNSEWTHPTDKLKREIPFGLNGLTEWGLYNFRTTRWMASSFLWCLMRNGYNEPRVITLYSIIMPLKYAFENIMKNGAFPPLEQMLHFPWYFQKYSKLYLNFFMTFFNVVWKKKMSWSKKAYGVKGYKAYHL